MYKVNEWIIYAAIAVGLYFALASDELQKKYMPTAITKFTHNQRQIAGAVLVAGSAYWLMYQQEAQIKNESIGSSTLPLPTDLQSSTINLSSF